MTPYLDENGELQGAIVTSGHRMDLIAIAVAKWALQHEMPSDLKLRYLEFLEKRVDSYIRPEMVVMISPFCEKGMQIVKASGVFDRQKADLVPNFTAWKILESQHVFGLLLKLYPSILEAICWHETTYRQSRAAKVAA
jgi:hypothetical protein